ncbi:MAG: radical SAM protein [bacterium]
MSWTLKKHLQNILAREQGAVMKDWGGKASVALVYPNTYRVGMGNLAIHSIYRMLNSRSGIVCERAFLPDKREMREHMRMGAPVLSIESQRPLSDFDWVAVSVSFENDYLNILPMLEMCRIPHMSDERGEGMPLIIAGGAAPTLNPWPMSRIADAVVMGEMEAYAADLIPLIESRAGRADALAELGAMNGVLAGSTPPYLPLQRGGIIKALRPRHVADLDSIKTQTVIYARDVEFGDMHLIEVERGCPRRCSFCATPVIYGGHRRRSAAAVIAMVDEGLAHRKKFGLIGADILSHPQFVEIAEAIHARGATFSPSSVRADAIDDSRARLLAASSHRSVALGVEAGSERLRKELSKGLTDERLLSAVATLARAGITRLRLYFMLGLPGETDEDVAAITELACRVRDELRAAAPKSARTTAVDLTVTPFVPKPSTPLAGGPFAGEPELKRRVKEIRRAVGKSKGLTARFDSINEARIEWLLANGGADAIELITD